MLAIAGGKGGCGKTTTALGFAHALASEGTTPLVVDADSDMPNVHAVAETPMEPTVADVAAGADAVDLAVESGRFPGVAVLGAAEPSATARGLARLDWPHGPVVLDCPAGADRTAATPLRAADRTLLVTLATRQSVTDTAKTAEMARTLDAPPVGVVCNRCTEPPPLADVLDCEVRATVPDVSSPPLSEPAVLARFDRLSAVNTRRNI
jgi:septum site-determining protein MinD